MSERDNTCIWAKHEDFYEAECRYIHRDRKHLKVCPSCNRRVEVDPGFKNKDLNVFLGAVPSVSVPPCPRCRGLMLPRWDYTLGFAVYDPKCSKCGYSKLGSQDLEAQARHDAYLATLMPCKVVGCETKISPKQNKSGFCEYHIRQINNYKNRSTKTPPPLIEIKDPYYKYKLNPEFRGNRHTVGRSSGKGFAICPKGSNNKYMGSL